MASNRKPYWAKPYLIILCLFYNAMVRRAVYDLVFHTFSEYCILCTAQAVGHNLTLMLR